MRRATAESVEEICERHGCVARVDDGDPLPSIDAYADLAIVRGDDPVLPSLTQTIHAIRLGWEVVEIYIRPRGETAFQPLEMDPVGLLDPIREEPVPRQRDGTWAIVARRRHPSYGPRVVGIMMAKDEADIVHEVVRHLSDQIQNLFFSAGDAPTRDVIVASNSVNGWAREAPAPIGMRTDGHRQVLLDMARDARDHEGDRRPTWVVSVQGDEIYHDDLLRHVIMADEERATVLNCQVATFLPHESQREGWDWTQPLGRRLTYYIWDFGEHTGFLDLPWLHYKADEHMRAHPRGIYPGVWAKKKPVRKHYPFRSPEQMRARIEDRLKSGWQPHYAHYQDVFLGDVAAGRIMRPWLGWFPEKE